MSRPRSTEAKIAFNIYDSGHKLLAKLAEKEKKPMIVILQEMIEARAKDKKVN